MKALFDASCKWRLVEEFGTDYFEEQADGKLLFHADYTDVDNLLTWLFTFQDRVILLEPEDLRQKLMETLEKMRQLYREG